MFRDFLNILVVLTVLSYSSPVNEVCGTEKAKECSDVGNNATYEVLNLRNVSEYCPYLNNCTFAEKECSGAPKSYIYTLEHICSLSSQEGSPSYEPIAYDASCISYDRLYCNAYIFEINERSDHQQLTNNYYFCDLSRRCAEKYQKCDELTQIHQTIQSECMEASIPQPTTILPIYSNDCSYKRSLDCVLMLDSANDALDHYVDYVPFCRTINKCTYEQLSCSSLSKDYIFIARSLCLSHIFDELTLPSVTHRTHGPEPATPIQDVFTTATPETSPVTSWLRNWF